MFAFFELSLIYIFYQRHAVEWNTAKEVEKAEQAKDKERRLKAALAAKREPSSNPSNGEADSREGEAVDTSSQKEANGAKMEVDSQDPNSDVKMEVTSEEAKPMEEVSSGWFLFVSRFSCLLFSLHGFLS